jgi:Transposase/Transposase IS116/IS110/IS902 family
MGMVLALDVHRNQITYKALDRETGELSRGRIAPAARAELRAWLGQFAGCEVEFALEGTTGWRFVVEEIERAGHRAHLADPAETAARRGRKRRAKTDNADCDLQLRLLLAGELPESRIPPAHLLELRTLVRLRKTLIDQRTAWQQTHPRATLPPRRAGRTETTHRDRPGGAAAGGAFPGRTGAGRARAAHARQLRSRAGAARPPAACVRPPPARLPRADRAPLRGRAGQRDRDPGRARRLGRFSSSDDAVRHAGLDITVYQSDDKRAPGRLSHEGPELLRWALYEAAVSAARAGSPDHAYYRQVAERLDHNRACLSVARKLCRRAHHLLRELGEEALAPIEQPADEEALPAAA